MGVAPARSQAAYFAIAAAITGVTGAMGTAAGGFLAQSTSTGGLPGLFALSAVLRLVALLPLVFVQEQRSQSLTKLWREAKQALSTSLSFLSKDEICLSAKPQPLPIQTAELINRSK
jgi:hypothetical protein